MDADAIQNRSHSRLKLFFALSRTPHGLLDMATPAFAALLWLGAFPSLKIIALGLITAFAGYTAVYALNDVIDYRSDRRKIGKAGLGNPDNYLDAVLARHPLAQGFLGLGESIAWTVSWSVLAATGAYLLNPVCLIIFMAGCALEAVYCLLFRISHLRAFISGAVKSSGGLAAVFAVDPSPSPFYLILLFLWLFVWEIGGQNIPADWTDLEEDAGMHAATIPVRLGPEKAACLVIVSLITAVGLTLILFIRSPGSLEWPLVAAILVSGTYLLLLPAYRLFKTKDKHYASMIFNRASYYPLVLLTLVVIMIGF